MMFWFLGNTDNNKRQRGINPGKTEQASRILMQTLASQINTCTRNSQTLTLSGKCKMVQAASLFDST